jgi:hypothetical protein
MTDALPPVEGAEPKGPEDTPAPAASPSASPAPPARTTGWTRLLLGLAAFVLLPLIPQLRAVLPVEQTAVLFVPALAACALVGWWAGGRPALAIVWILAAVLITIADGSRAGVGAFHNLVQGRPFFSRALMAVVGTFGLAAGMSLLGPVTPARAASTFREEFTRRNSETMAATNGWIASHPTEWKALTDKIAAFRTAPEEIQRLLTRLSDIGMATFPALLALESLATLALAWATYHRLARTRLGVPLAPLRDFRFNDQLVWGLIVGIVILLLPTLATWRGVGRNLVVFFGALYAVRGLGVLAWFLAPGALTLSLAVGGVMLWLPFLQAAALLGFLALGITALGLGLGDTWADWRRRAQATTSRP